MICLMNVIERKAIAPCLKTLFSVAVVMGMLLFTSCATIMQLDNNKKWKMGIDVITEKPDPITVTVNGREAKHFRQYDGATFNVDYVILPKAVRDLDITITQNGVTKSGKFRGDKVKGLFWFEFLWVFLDHATGALRQYPAVRFEDMKELNAGK